MNSSISFFIVLGLLDTGKKSGYDIKRIIENSIGHYCKISNGQIYPALKSILHMAYATLSVEKNDGKPDRKVYRITDKGSAAFRQWLTGPVDYHNPSGNELLLRLYFGSQAPAEHNIRLITSFMEMKSGFKQIYDNTSKCFNPSTITNLADHYDYITLRYGQILTNANIEWCNETIAYIKQLEEKQ